MSDRITADVYSCVLCGRLTLTDSTRRPDPEQPFPPNGCFCGTTALTWRGTADLRLVGSDAR